jgi:hypothetical protein
MPVRPDFLVLKLESHSNPSSDHQAAVGYPDLRNNPNSEDHPNILQTLNLNLTTTHSISITKADVLMLFAKYSVAKMFGLSNITTGAKCFT